jgi:hypothetical protein
MRAVDTAAVLQLEVVALQLQLKQREQDVQQLGAQEQRSVELLQSARSAQDEMSRRLAAMQEQLQEQTTARQVAATSCTTQHSTEAKPVLPNQHAHAAHSTALRRFCKRSSRRTVRAREAATAAAVLAAWQRKAARQRDAVWSWRVVSRLLLEAQPPQRLPPAMLPAVLNTPSDLSQASLVASGSPEERGVDASASICQQRSGSADSFMRRLLRRRAHTAGTCLDSVRLLKLGAACFRAWRMLARLQARHRAVKQVSAICTTLAAPLLACSAAMGSTHLTCVPHPGPPVNPTG